MVSAVESSFELSKAFLSLETDEECIAFLKDLCTPAEINAMEERWRVCQLLAKGISHTQIHDETGVSMTTIGRVSRFLRQENYKGYERILKRLHSPQGENSIHL